MNTELNLKDLIIQTFLKPGGGGWSIQPETHVRITHKPTGLSADRHDDRSVHRNRANALEDLTKKVEIHYNQLKLKKRIDENNAKVKPFKVEGEMQCNFESPALLEVFKARQKRIRSVSEFVAQRILVQNLPRTDADFLAFLFEFAEFYDTQ